MAKVEEYVPGGSGMSVDIGQQHALKIFYGGRPLPTREAPTNTTTAMVVRSEELYIKNDELIREAKTESSHKSPGAFYSGMIMKVIFQWLSGVGATWCNT